MVSGEWCYLPSTELLPSTQVMGLTLGAVGTSFPNLYASVITARQGEPDMAIAQACISWSKPESMGRTGFRLDLGPISARSRLDLSSGPSTVLYTSVWLPVVLWSSTQLRPIAIHPTRLPAVLRLRLCF